MELNVNSNPTALSRVASECLPCMDSQHALAGISPAASSKLWYLSATTGAESNINIIGQDQWH